MEAEPRRRRRFVISVRSLMLLVLAVAVWLGWITYKARQQRIAVAAIREFGGSVAYDWEVVSGKRTPTRGPWAPRWLRRALGDEYFQEVVEVSLFDVSILEGPLQRPRPMTEVVMGHLGELPRLKRLHLGGNQATDEGLRNIVGLTCLEDLDVWDAEELGDAGIAHLAGLKNLKCLLIENSRMTDLGIGRLKGLTGLEKLILPGNHLTDDGLAHIGGFKKLSFLCVAGGGHITDAGLVHLAGLSNLGYLAIRQCKVSNRGLEHLKGLTKLKVFSAGETKLTDEGTKKLKEAVPSLKSVVQ
jgi:hypothetical protein